MFNPYLDFCFFDLIIVPNTRSCITKHYSVIKGLATRQSTKNTFSCQEKKAFSLDESGEKDLYKSTGSKATHFCHTILP